MQSPTGVIRETGQYFDDTNAGANRQGAEQFGDVFRVQAHAAMTHPHANAGRLVRAVDQIAGQIQAYGVGPERIVRPGRNHRWQGIAGFLVLLAD